MPANSELIEHIDAHHNAFIYVYQGQIQLADQQELPSGHLAVLTRGKQLSIKANQDSQFIVVSGQPLNEPIERAGPFVMNTRDEIQQAFQDYQAGNFTQ